MKKIAFMLAMFALLLASCQKNEELSLVSENEVFTASVESFDAQTKTSMTQDRQVVWSSNDRIAIFQGSTIADEYKATDASAGKSNAIFDIVSDNSEVNGSFSAGVEVSRNIALYPYADNLSLEASTLDDEGSAYEIAGFVLPSTQNYAAGSFGNGSFPMVAVTSSMTDHTLKFKNLLGVMKLQFKGTQTVKSIKVEGKNSEKLSGAATITAYATNLTPAITMSETAGTSVTLDCGDGVQLNESTATDFFIALPPVLFSKGFKVTVTDSENNETVIQTDVTNTVLRSSILSMPTVILGDEVTEDDEDNPNDDIEYPVEAITLNKTSLTLAPDTSFPLTAKVLPTNATYKTLTWSSEDMTVATIDQSGVITAVSDGTATITAVAVGGITGSCKVTVITPKAATADYVDEYGVNHGKGISLGGTVWAPVNCGYKAATTDAGGNVTDKGFPYGKLYQWGRKYGQGYSLDYDSSVPTLEEGPVSMAYGQSDSMKEYFFINASSHYDWVSSPDGDLWNSGTDKNPIKTENDPCPAGWRVPNYSELSGVVKKYSNLTSDQNGYYGRYFSGDYLNYDVLPESDESQVFFPLAGYRGNDGSADDRDYDGYYWSSRYDYINAYAFYLYFYYSNSIGVSFNGGGYRAKGYSVRCVQE